MRVDFVKVQGGSFWFLQSSRGFCEIAISRVRVDLVKIKGVFCKIDIHKVQGPFSCKIAIHRLQVDTKFEGFLVKFISQLFLTVGLVVEEF